MKFSVWLSRSLGLEVEVSLTGVSIEIGSLLRVFIQGSRPLLEVGHRASRMDDGTLTGEVFICGLTVSYDLLGLLAGFPRRKVERVHADL